MNTALVIVDLQNDFLDPRGAYARGGCANPLAQALPARVLPLARAIKGAGGLVVASQFTLWPDTNGEPLVSPHLRALRPFLARGDFAPGSWGQAHVDLLAPVIDALTMPTSPFFKAKKPMMISGALPMVAFSKPPTVGPR